MLAASLLVAALPACTNLPFQMIGSKPGDTPPQLVTKPTDQKILAWDNPSAFGPVPDELAAKGEAVCASLDHDDLHFKAIGYHPLAKDRDGHTLPQGGYFCVQK